MKKHQEAAVSVQDWTKDTGRNVFQNKICTNWVCWSIPLCKNKKQWEFKVSERFSQRCDQPQKSSTLQRVTLMVGVFTLFCMVHLSIWEWTQHFVTVKSSVKNMFLTIWYLLRAWSWGNVQCSYMCLEVKVWAQTMTVIIEALIEDIRLG